MNVRAISTLEYMSEKMTNSIWRPSNDRLLTQPDHAIRLHTTYTRIFAAAEGMRDLASSLDKPVLVPLGRVIHT